jgi:hypothetical protein
VTIELLMPRPDRICGFPSMLISPTRRPSVTFEYEVLVRNEGTNCAVLGDEDSAPPRGVSWKPLRRAKTESLRRRFSRLAPRRYHTLCEKIFHTKAFLSTKAPHDIILYFRPPLAYPGSFKYIPTTGGKA